MSGELRTSIVNLEMPMDLRQQFRDADGFKKQRNGHTK